MPIRLKTDIRASFTNKRSDAIITMETKPGITLVKANKALVKALSNYFDIPKSRISISSGLGSKNKIVAIH